MSLPEEAKEFYTERKQWIPFIGFFVLAILICGLGLYLTSDSLVETPKADKYGQQSANSHTESVVAETEANTIDLEVKKINTERLRAKKEEARKAKAADKQKKALDKRKKEYEVIRKKDVVVSGDDLDDRKRKLLAKLREQQKH